MGHPAWEPWQIELLKEEYGITQTAILAEKIGKKSQAIIQYAHKHGISAKRYWTDEEEEYLVNHIGIYSTQLIAHNLHKSYRQVLDKMQKMHLGNFLDNSEYMNLSAVCYLVNRDKETIKRVWFRNGLKKMKKGKYIMISESNLCDWMKTHKRYWDATECDYYFFSRFDWFQSKYNDDSMAKRYKRWNICMEE